NPVGGAQSEISVPWCSLECTPACQAGGRGFKSRRDRHLRSSPPGRRRLAAREGGGHGRVAQLAERPPEKRKVTGSTPVPTTRMTRPKRLVIVHFRDGAGATAGPGSRPGPRRLTSSSFGVAQDRTSFTPLDPAPNEPTPIER